MLFNSVQYLDPIANRWLDMRCGYLRVFYNKPSDGLNVSDSDDSISEAISEELNEEKQTTKSKRNPEFNIYIRFAFFSFFYYKSSNLSFL